LSEGAIAVLATAMAAALASVAAETRGLVRVAMIVP
jgi:hypothetical protein